ALDIPVVDLGELSSHDQSVHAHAAAALERAFGEFGLVYVRAHGIDPATLDLFYDRFGAFCDLPLETKQRYGRPEIWFQRGWTPPNTERAVIAGGQPDFKECWFAAPEPLDPVAKAQYPEVYADNIWPDGDPDFERAMLAVGHQLHRIGLALLRGCAARLQLAPYAFEALTDGGPHVTRALKYLALAS
ncbi:MAG: isopenicillin N synthase family oxygenase, partial [Myxococcales bacterium]|nr:isopenicillin N synthase family oxygenase [Myxococcales bacterium]